MKIYHNPRCMKSRETLKLITDKGLEPEIILYMENPLKTNELKNLLKKLSITASELIRTSEKIYKEEYKGKKMTEAQWVKAMITHPKLMQRPIVVSGDRAVLGRPPENVLELC